MTATKLEALMRNIILHRRLPFTFHSVSAAGNGWHIVVCDAAGATLSLTVPAGRPLDIRNAIRDRLETAVEDAAFRQAAPTDLR
jgi:hypothetical protein